MSSNSDVMFAAATRALEGQHDTVVDAVWRVVVAHWYDEALLAALFERPPHRAGTVGEVPPVAPDLLFLALEALPFCESFGEPEPLPASAPPDAAGRARIHAEVRRILLDRLLEHDRDFVVATSATMASSLADRPDPDDDVLLELAFHLLISNEEVGAKIVNDLFASARGPGAVAVLERLMLYVDELRGAELLSAQSAAQAEVWSVWVKAAAGDYVAVARLAEDRLSRLDGYPDEADLISYEAAFAYHQLGEPSLAAELARGVAGRHPSDHIGVLARILLSDGAEDPADALGQLLASLAILRASDQPAGDGVPDPADWTVGVTEDAAEGDDAAAVLVSVRHTEQEWLGFPADLLFAEVFLRIANLVARRGLVADAFSWLDLARRLFEFLGDDGGLDRVTDASQYLAAGYGDLLRLREVLSRHQDMLQWARAEEVPAVELDALLKLGNAHYILNELDAAESAYQAAFELAERLDDDFHRGSVAEGLARVAVARGRFDRAEKHLALAARYYQPHNPDLARRLDFVVGDRFMVAQEPGRAVTAYQRVVEWAAASGRAEDEVSARLALARAERDRQNLPAARRQLDAASELLPRVDQLLRFCASTDQILLLRLENRDREADALERQLEVEASKQSLTSHLAWLHYNRGYTGSRRGDTAGALAAYTRALELFEANADTEGLFHGLNALAWTHSEAGNHVDALAAIERAQQLADATDRPAWTVDTLFTRGLLLVEAGRSTEAIPLLAEAQRLAPDNARICLHLGWTCLRADRLEESLTWSYRALELNPDDAFANRNIGHALLALGRLDEAKQAYAIAIERRFGDEHFRNTLEELELLDRRHPGLPGFAEIVTLFTAEQRKLDAEDGF